MDKRYRDMTKPKRPRSNTMKDPDSPKNQVKRWLARGGLTTPKTKEEIIRALPELSWGQINAVISRMRKRNDAFKDEHKRMYPNTDAKERDIKIDQMFVEKWGEQMVQFDPKTGKYGHLSWERKNVVNQRQEAMQYKATVRVSSRRYNNREIGVSPQVLDAAHIGLSTVTGTVTDSLMHHTCGALVGPSMGFCPQCGVSLRPKQLEDTKQIGTGE